MSEHLFDSVPHDEGRGHDPLLAGEVHGVELTGSVSAQGASNRGTVGTAAPTTLRRRRFRDSIVQDIGASHPNALSRLDRLDGVGNGRV